MKRKQNPAGFLLVVEAALIDVAHHSGEAARALEETLELEAAVSAVLKEVDLEETLVLVTADHSHTLSIGGYPDRGSDIRGVLQFCSNRALRKWPQYRSLFQEKLERGAAAAPR